jgi:hypothetical protein
MNPRLNEWSVANRRVSWRKLLRRSWFWFDRKIQEICFLMGEVSFSATLSGADLCDGAQPLAAAICSRSHVFFLREKDVFQAASKSA